MIEENNELLAELKSLSERMMKCTTLEEYDVVYRAVAPIVHQLQHNGVSLQTIQKVLP